MVLLAAKPALAVTALSLDLVRVTPVTASTPLSGSDIQYEVQLQCAAVSESFCNGTRVTLSELPFEVAEIDVGAHPLLVNSSFVRGTQGANPADGSLTLEFIDPLPAGTSLTLSLVMRTDNGRTPDGFTWPVPGTATADNAPTVTATSDGTVYAQAQISVTKEVLPDPPPVDVAVRYTIDACSPGAGQLGNLFLQNNSLVDTLPAGAVFVDASPGGVYDAGANTVTWQPAVLGSKPCTTPANFWVDVRFPGTVFGTVAPLVTQVDNLVDVSGTPFGDTTPITDTDSLTHNFTDLPVPSGSAGKRSYSPICCNSPGPYTYPGDWVDNSGGTADSEAIWQLSFQNTGLVPLSVEFNDRLPCAYAAAGRAAHTSPLAGEALCTEPSFVTQSVTLTNRFYSAALQAGYSPIWTSTSGATGTFTVVSSDSYRTYMEPVGLAAGDTIAEIRFPADPLAVAAPQTNAGTVAYINGHMIDQPASGPWTNDIPVINREDSQLYVGSEPVGAGGSVQARIRVLVPELRAKISKQIRNDGTVWLYGSNQSGVPMPGAVLTDLLPPGVTFHQLTEVWVNTDDTAMNLVDTEVIDNFAGTGRQLVRVTLKPGVELNPVGGPANSNNFVVSFATHGLSVAERPPGRTYNTGQFHLPGGTALAGCIDIYGRSRVPFTGDSDDLDGDGVASPDNHCAATTSVSNNTTSTYLVAEKFVRGNLDTSFETFPTVGSANSPGSGTFELRLRNRSNVELTNLVVYDLLPRVGDTGVLLDGVPRESDFVTALTVVPSVTGAPAPGAVIEYSTALNPCRGELQNPPVARDQWPASCDDTWLNTAPADLSAVTAIRITGLGVLPADPGDTSTTDDRTISYTVSVPSSLDPGDVAWNSFAVAGERVETGGSTAPFLSTEPPKVGISVPQTDVELAKTVNGGDSASVPIGSIVDYELTVSHGTSVTVNADGSVTYANSAGSASSTAPSVVVTDAIPAGVEIVPGSSTTLCGGSPGGSFSETTGVWAVGDIEPGDSFKLCYQATIVGVAGTSTYTNLAEVSNMGPGVPDIDSEPGNIGATPVQDDEADAVVTVLLPAIELKKQVWSENAWHEADEGTADLPIFHSGEAIRYRFVATNIGQVTLTNVALTDPKFSGYCDRNLGTLTTLPAGMTRTVICDWPFGWGAGTTVNTAFVTGDPPAGNPVTDENTAQVTVIDPTAVTIGSVELNSASVAKFLEGLGVAQSDRAALLELLAAWDSTLAAALADADREAILEALKRYLDPDGDGTVAVLGWDTLEERGTIGFYVERQGSEGAWIRVNGDMLPGVVTAPLGAEYMLADPAAQPGNSYRYRLIEVEATGTKRHYGPYSVQMP